MLEEEGGGIWGKVGSTSAKYGAKVGKKIAQSEAGRAAGKAAIKGATKSATDELCNRYFGSTSPPPEETKKQPSSTSEKKEEDKTSSRSSQPEETTSSKTSSSTTATSETKKTSREEGPSIGQKLSNFSERVKTSSSAKYQDWKSSREHKFTGPSQTPESAQKRAEAVLAKKRIKSAIVNEANWDKLPMCEALYNFRGELPCDLQFRKGQRIALICRTDSTHDWWEGRVNEKTGIFPSNYVKLL